MVNLTDKQEKFIEEIISGKTQIEAYKSAYDASKMKDSSIRSRASEVFLNPNVQARYNEIRAAALKSSSHDAEEIRAKVINQDFYSAFYDVADYYEVRGDLMQVRPLDQLTPAQRAAIKEVRTTSLGWTYYVFNDRRDAIESLKELFKLNEDQQDDNRAEVVLSDDLEAYKV